MCRPKTFKRDSQETWGLSSKSLPTQGACQPTCSIFPTHLHIIRWEDAQPAVVFPLQPVLVHFFMDVDNVTLLQSQLPAGESSVYLTGFLSRSSSDPALHTTSPSSLLLTKAPPFPTGSQCTLPRL